MKTTGATPKTLNNLLLVRRGGGGGRASGAFKDCKISRDILENSTDHSRVGPALPLMNRKQNTLSIQCFPGMIYVHVYIVKGTQKETRS